MGAKDATVRWWATVVATLVVVLLLGGAYLYVYVSGKEEYLTKRDLLLLGSVGDRLRQKVENYGNDVLPNATKPPWQEKALEKRPVELSARIADHLRLAGSLGLVARPALTQLKPDESASPGVTLRPARSREEWGLFMRYAGPAAAATGERVSVSFEVWSSLRDLVGPVRSGIFDDLLLVAEDGDVIYQHNPSAPRVIHVSQLVEGKKPAKDAKPDEKNGKGPPEEEPGERVPRMLAQASNVLDRKLAGSDYKVFLQPVRISLRVADAATADRSPAGKTYNWILCGLVRSDRFRAESFAISYTLLLLFVLVVLLIALSWPFLKLWYMGPKDRLRSRDVLYLAFSFLGVSALLTLFLLDVEGYWGLDRRLDKQLESFAEDLKAHLTRELEQACILLDGLQTKVRLEDDPQWETRIMGRKDLLPAGYPGPDGPFFDMVSWADSTGQQRKKWTVKDTPTPFVSVGARNYFRKAKGGDLWTIQAAGGKEYRFWLEPVYSWNTGEALPILSMRARKEGWVTTLDLSLLSLFQTVVPPGFGYAVIEDDGKVLFHSDSSRILLENLFEECDQDRALRAAVFGRGNELLSVSYGGRDHRFYVAPMRVPPWTMVVFRDKEILRTLNLEALTESLALYMVYLLLLLPFGWIFVWGPGVRSGWLWPDRERAPDYRFLLTAYVVVVILFLAGILAARPEPVLCSALLLPLWCAVLAYVRCEPNRQDSWTKRIGAPLLLYAIPGILILVDIRGNSWRVAAAHALGSGLLWAALQPRAAKALLTADWPTYRGGYVAAKVCLLVLAGVLPSVAFFRIAFDAETEAFVKHGQFLLGKAIGARDERVKAKYSPLDPPKELLEERHGSSLDVYEEFFFDTRPEKPAALAAGPPHARPVETLLGELRLLFLYNRAAVETQELLRDAAADDSFEWLHGNGRLVFHKKGDPVKDMVLSSSLPAFRAPPQPLWWLGMAAVLAVLYLLVMLVARKVFLLDWVTPPGVRRDNLESWAETHNVLILGAALTGKSTLLEELKEKASHVVIDLRKEVKKENWSQVFSYDSLARNKLVAVDHLEHRMSDPRLNREKLEFLEGLLEWRRTLIVASAVDPKQFPLGAELERKQRDSSKKDADSAREREGAEDTAAQLAGERWARLWDTFSELYLVDTADPAVFQKALDRCWEKSPVPKEALLRILKSECALTGRLQDVGAEICAQVNLAEASPEALLSEILERARPYYQGLWSTCSKEEKVALFDLAQDGFLNSESPGVYRLLNKGLVVRKPHLRLLNETFRRFIVAAGRVEPVEAWGPGSATSRWGLLKAPLAGVLASVAVFLFVTQPQVFQGSMGFIAALSAGLPALFKLFDIFRRGQQG